MPREPDAQNIRNICVFMRIGMPEMPEAPGLGDLVTRNIGLLLIARRYPRARIHLVADQRLLNRCRELFLRHSWIDELIACPDSGDRSPLRWLAFLKRMRARRFDLCVMDAASRSALPAFLSGIPRRIGLATTGFEGLLLTRCVQLQASPGGRSHPHGADMLHFAQAYARALGHTESLTPADLVPRFPFQPEQFAGTGAPRPIIAIHAGGATHWNRRWPIDAYAQLCSTLTRKLGATLFLLGGGENERQQNAWLAERTRQRHPSARVHDFSDSSLNLLANSLSMADLFVGNDSGLMHVAAALGRRMVVICGPVSSAYWQRTYHFGMVVSRNRECLASTEFSWQRHRRREVSCQKHACPYAFDPERPIYPRCLESITVDEVLAAIRIALARPPRLAACKLARG